MTYIIAGLGNPGEEYEGTRHNVGRMVVEYFAKKHECDEWKDDKKIKARTAKGKVGKESVVLVAPETFMNNSGKALVTLVKSKKQAEQLVVVYDDLDLPLGTLKISFDRGSGGHRGLESVIKALKTRAFVRLRVGVSPATPSGKLKKPQGEKAVIDFILGKFKPKDIDVFKKVLKRANDALESIIQNGREIAAGEVN
ncbi:MAG: aminoacyl-tRNA hydrolase [Minisyncoccota bacterium]